MSSTEHSLDALARTLTTDAEPILHIYGGRRDDLVVQTISVDAIDQGWPECLDVVPRIVNGLLAEGVGIDVEYDVDEYVTIRPETVRHQWQQIVAALSPEDHALLQRWLVQNSRTLAFLVGTV